MTKVDRHPTPSIYLSVFAGGAAHFAETVTFGHLVDRLMVQQQAFPAIRSILESFRSIYHNEGKSGFYKGFRWNVLSSAAKGAGGWTILNTCSNGLSFIFPQKNSSDPSFQFNALLASNTAIIETTLLLGPFERLKIVEMTALERLQTLKMARDGGRKFIYRGWSVMVVQKSLSWLSYLTFYQHHRRYFFNGEDERSLSTSQKMALGFGTGCFIASFSTPLDLLKTQLQKHSTIDVPSIPSIITSIYRAHGYKGFFRGLPLRIIRTGWSGAVITLVLDRLNAFPIGMKI